MEVKPLTAVRYMYVVDHGGEIEPSDYLPT